MHIYYSTKATTKTLLKPAPLCLWNCNKKVHNLILKTFKNTNIYKELHQWCNQNKRYLTVAIQHRDTHLRMRRCGNVPCCFRHELLFNVKWDFLLLYSKALQSHPHVDNDNDLTSSVVPGDETVVSTSWSDSTCTRLYVTSAFCTMR